MEVLLGKIMATLLLPPGLNIAMVLFGLLLRLRFARTGSGFIYAGFILLIVFSMPLVSNSLQQSQENFPALDVASLAQSKAKVIVVLGGGRNPAAPEYQNEDTVSIHALERIRYGAYLQRKSKLPILFSGGSVFGNEVPEAQLMKKTLEDAFIGVTQWMEGKSRTTYENALYTHEMLAKENIQDIILVTQAFHMNRAKEAFEQMGFHVTPAATGFSTPSNRPWYLDVLPSADALKSTAQVLHELIGRGWYHLRYYK